ARVERARERLRVVVGGVDRGLEVHPEMHVGEERVERPLILLIASGRTEREHGLVVTGDERRRERRPGTLAGRERVRQPLLEPEHLRARTEAEAELGNDGGAVEPAAAR